MKLPKYTSTIFTSASLTVCVLGISSTSAQAQIMVSDEVSSQISQVLGEADEDQVLVDRLSQIESELRSYEVPSFTPAEEDASVVVQLKQERIALIDQLRERVAGLSPEEKRAFLGKIQQRRKQVRTKLLEIRRERQAELSDRRNLFKQRVEEKQELMRQDKEDAAARATQAQEEAREHFKTNVKEQQEAAKERNLSPEQKFSNKVNRKIERTSADPAGVEAKKENLQEVKGAMDYQPQNLFEWLGYHLFGKVS